MVDLNLTASYDYELPPALIATEPTRERTASRLLVLEPGREPNHGHFSDIGACLKPGDLLVRNVSKVIPARLEGRKVPGGGRVELLVLEVLDRSYRDPGPTRFRALYSASKPLKPGALVDIGMGYTLVVIDREADGKVQLETRVAEPLLDILERCGQVPLPPYIIKRRRALDSPLLLETDRVRYQTVYAREPGAVAAPTAGLHFTQALFESLGRQGVEVADLSLDVGAGTFKPIAGERLDDHDLHTERYELPEQAAGQVNRALREGRRIVAVGTTVLRALEDQATRGPQASAGRWETALFIRPGCRCRWVQALITNFHLPRSSLLTLVTAFGGYERVMAAYGEAIARSYRFYSYGDAMFLTRAEG